MADVQTEEIPTRELEKVDDMVLTMKQRFNGQVSQADRDRFAKLYDHESAESGAFTGKLTTLRKYGLIDGWGDVELTEIAETYIENETAATHDIIEDIELFSNAFEEFGRSPVSEPEWADFLRYHGVDEPQESDIWTSRRAYNSLIRKIPATVETEFSETDFNRYYNALEDDGRRDVAIGSLTDMARHEIPSLEPFDKIFSIVDAQYRPDTDPSSPDFHDELTAEQTHDILHLLRIMVAASSYQIQAERETEITNLAIDIIDAADPENDRWDDEIHEAIHILRLISPRQSQTEELWEIALDRAREHVEEGEYERLNTTDRIVRKILRGWAERELLEQIEEDIFDELATDDEEYKDWLSGWHSTCRRSIKDPSGNVYYT